VRPVRQRRPGAACALDADLAISRVRKAANPTLTNEEDRHENFARGIVAFRRRGARRGAGPISIQRRAAAQGRCDGDYRLEIRGLLAGLDITARPTAEWKE